MRFLAVVGALAIIVVIAAAVFFFGGFYNVAANEQDNGAVAWPGDIDLAPDAMYDEIARENHAPPVADQAVPTENR